MIELVKKIRNRIRYRLMLATLQDRLSSKGINIRLHYLIQEGLNDVNLPEFKGNLEDYSFEFFGPQEMKMIGATQEKKGKKDQLISRLKKGKKCFGVKHHGQIVAYNWFDFNESYFYKKRIRLNDHEAYLFDMYTMKEYRGKNIAPYLRFESYKVLRRMGKNKLYSVSDFLNTPAIKFKRKLGAKFLKLYLYIELLKKYRRRWIIKEYRI